MNVGYVCNRLKELIQDYKDSVDANNQEVAEKCLNRIRGLAREAQMEAKWRTDSAFFSGELDCNIGEKNVQYPDAVSEYRKRKRKRKDARSVKNYKERRQKRLDADDGRWVTTENDHKIHINEEGVPDKGNPFVLNAISGEKSQKTFHYERPEKQEKTLQNIIKRTANLKKEQYRIIDSDGNVVVENRGKEHEVHSKIGEKREHLKGNISIHNHPAGGTFSSPDLRDFGYGAREILAASPEGTYSLVNTKYGQKDQYDGWLDMQRALDEATPEVSEIGLLQKARKNLENCPERKRMAEISSEFVKRKDDGESLDSLRGWLLSTDYSEQEESYKKKVEKERRRLEVEPFDKFFKENAEKYGFKYMFTKSRYDAVDDEDGQWITTENGHKVHLSEGGEPDMGNPHVIDKMNGESDNERTVQAGSSLKRKYNDEISSIVDSDSDFETKINKVSDILKKLPIGTRVDFPDTWTSDDGTKNYGIYQGDELWKCRYGKGKNDTWSMDNTEMAGYFASDDKNERPVISKVPEEKKEREYRDGKHKHDGSVIGNRLEDFHNDNVKQEDRDRLKYSVQKSIDYSKLQYGYDDRKQFFAAGQIIRDEIQRRHNLRKHDKEDYVDGDDPEAEDVFEALRDIRQFGPSDEFVENNVNIYSDIDDEKTNAIVREAMSVFPTDWFDEMSSDGKQMSVCIHDNSGRAHYDSFRNAIHVYTKLDPSLAKDLKIEDDYIGDRGLTNTIVHEMGHLVENNVPRVGSVARKCLEDRTAKSEEEYLEEGYTTKKDKFFNSYMGKQYPWGDTEITSVLMQNLCGLTPFRTISGKGYFFADNKDPESLKYILGVLGGL